MSLSFRTRWFPRRMVDLCTGRFPKVWSQKGTQKWYLGVIGKVASDGCSFPGTSTPSSRNWPNGKASDDLGDVDWLHSNSCYRTTRCCLATWAQHRLLYIPPSMHMSPWETRRMRWLKSFSPSLKTAQRTKQGWADLFPPLCSVGKIHLNTKPRSYSSADFNIHVASETKIEE